MLNSKNTFQKNLGAKGTVIPKIGELSFVSIHRDIFSWAANEQKIKGKPWLHKEKILANINTRQFNPEDGGKIYRKINMLFSF